MKLRSAQIRSGEDRAAEAEIARSLKTWAHAFRPVDPHLADHFDSYRRDGNYALAQRIADLTDIDAYQRQLLALTFATGLDPTSHPAFDYLRRQPFLTGNTKARHVILMAHAMQAPA